VVVKQVVAGGSGASWVLGTRFGGVLLGLAVYVVVLELLLVVLSRAKQGMRPSSTMTWRWCGVVQGMERGVGARAGVSGVLWDGSCIVVRGSGAGRVRPLSRRRVLMNASFRSRITAFAGL
jgi:hypothetical protein